VAEQAEDLVKTRGGRGNDLVFFQSTKRSRAIKLTLCFEARVSEIVRLCLGLADLEFWFLSKLVARKTCESLLFADLEVFLLFPLLPNTRTHVRNNKNSPITPSYKSAFQ
jgi:hypothetical protein